MITKGFFKIQTIFGAEGILLTRHPNWFGQNWNFERVFLETVLFNIHDFSGSVESIYLQFLENLFYRLVYVWN